MEKKNNNGVIVGILIGIVIMLLVVGGLFLTNTISFNSKSGANEKASSNNNSNHNIEQSNSSESIDYEQIAKEKIPELIVIAHKANYSGKINSEDNFTENSDGLRYYVASSDYKSISDLKQHLSELLSSDLISKYFNLNEPYYIEKDNKLYSMSSMKDCGFDFIYDDTKLKSDAEYKLINKTDVSFDVEVNVPYTVSCDNKQLELIVTATISKIGSNWLITKYNDNAIYDVKY